MDSGKTPPDNLETTEAFEPEGESSRRIGHYRILQKVGEGGMGEVYEAEQEEPVRRRVALKVIKHGMDTKQVVARFEAERQALAMMDHPAVAKVFEAGATPRGRPYFVMEFVRGVPLNEHCDRQKLSVRDRLALFIQVCEGVQHAHRNAIIHRDLKPSNVLVSIQEGHAVPKIIDFGVAKATTQRLTEKTMFTEFGVLIGTPEYMSPEQAEGTGQSVDTRTDVYSLGVMLYELLVGALPFDPKELRSGGYAGIVKKIREDEPKKPSTRLSTLGDASTESAKSRHTDLPGLQRRLRGDLDWITMRALEKDRTRRYGSPSELAEDIRRHLRNEPVVASPPSAVYRARKFVRRNRVAVGVSTLVLGVLATFAVTTTVQSRRIARQAETSERVSEFLADMLGSVDPHVLGAALWQDLRERAADVRRGRGASEEEIQTVLASLEDALSGVNATDAALQLVDEQILSRAIETIDDKLAEDPLIAARLRHTIGKTYLSLGLREQGTEQHRKALEVRETELGRRHPDTLETMFHLGLILGEQAQLDEAEALLVETFEAQRRVIGPEAPGALRTGMKLGWLRYRQRRVEEAQELLLEVLRTQRRVLGDDHVDTLDTMTWLAPTYGDRGRFDEAEALHRESYEGRRRVLGEDHPATLISMGNLAVSVSRQGRHAEAEKLNRECLERRRRVLGDGHPQTQGSMFNLAGVLDDQGRFDEALSLRSAILEGNKRVHGLDHPRTLRSMSQVAAFLASHGRHAEAEALDRECLEGRRRILGDDDPETLSSMHNLANHIGAQGRYAEAEELDRECFERRRRVLGEDHLSTLYSMNNLAKRLGDQGRYAEAAPLYRESLEGRRRVLGSDHPDTVNAIPRLKNAYLKMERIDEARALGRELIEARRQAARGPNADPVDKNAYAWCLLTIKPADLRDPEEAMLYALEANEATSLLDYSHVDTLARAYFLTGDVRKAIELQEKAMALLPEGADETEGHQKRLAEYRQALESGPR